MATIARMIIAMGADPSGLRRGLNAGVQEMRQFSRSAAAIGASSNIFGKLDTPAKQAAASAVKAMQGQFATDMADLREQLTQGFIDERGFQQGGTNAARKFNDGLTRTMASLGTRNLLTPQIAAGVTSLYKNLGDDAARNFMRGFERMTQLTRSLGLATRRIGTELTAGVTLPIVGAAIASIKFSNEFNKAMGNVQSLIPRTGGRIYELRDAVRAVGQETNLRGSEIAQGLYLIISTFGDTARAAEILRDAAIVSVAGLSDMESSVELLATITRGFGDITGETTKKVSDLAFETVKWGVTTVPQLAASLGRVVPLTRELGASMEELFAVMATATGITGDTAEVSTQLRGILASLQDPSERLKTLYAELGVTGGKAAIAQFGLIGVIDRIKNAVDSSGLPIADFIHRIEGQVLALALAGEQSDVYRQRIEDMNNSAGATAAAFEAQTQGINKAGHEMEGLARRLEEMAERMGTALGPSILKAEPAINSLLKSLLNLVESFAKLDPGTQQFILTVAGLGAALGPAITALGILITTIASVARTLLLARTAGITFAAVMGVISAPATIAIAAIAAIVTTLYTFRKEISNADRAFAEWIASLADKARNLPLIGDMIAKIGEWFAGPEAVAAAKKAGETVASAYSQSLLNELGQPRVKPAPIQMPEILKGAGIRKPEPIVLIDPKIITQQVQTAIDQLNLFQEAGRSIQRPFQELERLQAQINARLAQGKLTIQDEMELTRALLNVRRELSDAAGTSTNAISTNMRLVVEQLELAQQRSESLTGPMDAVRVAVDAVTTRLERGNLSLEDRNRLTRDLVTASRALAEAEKPDTRAFDAFAAGARDALARLTALKQASQMDFKAPTSDAAERVNRLVQAQFLLNGGTREYESQLVRVRTAYANILGIIRETIAPTKEQLELARQLGAALEEAARKQLVSQAPVELRNTISELQVVANQYADAVAALQLAKERQDKAGVEAGKKEIAALQELALSIQQRIAQMVSSGAMAPGVGDAILARMRELIQGMGIDMENVNDKTAEWLKTLAKVGSEIATVIEGVLGILDGLGLVDNKTRKVIEGLATIAKNAPKAASGDPASIIAVIGGLVQTLGGLFGGKSPEEKAREAIYRQNTIALQRLTSEIGNIDLNITGFDFAAMQKAFATITDPSKFLLKDNTKLGTRVGGVLALHGLSIDDVKAAAEGLNLTFQNTADFYQKFSDALKEVELTSFTDTFTGQMDKVRRSFEILGITDPAAKFQAIVDVLTSPTVGAPALDFLKDADLTTAEGIKALQAKIATAFENFENLTPEQLGGLTPTQYLDALAEAAGLSREALEQLTGSVAAANHEMLNVPSGFRQARAEFLAAGAGVQMTPFEGPLANVSELPAITASETLNTTMQDLVTLLSERLLPGPLPTPTKSAEEMAKEVMTQFNVTVEAGAFRLDAGKAPAQQVDDFLRALRLKAHATSGDSTRIGEV